MANPTLDDLYRGIEDAELLLAQTSPAGFATVVEPDRFLCPPHVDLLSASLARLTEGGLKRNGRPVNRLLVTMPPRHGKSEMVSRYSPAWFLTKDPTKRVILSSYEADFAAEWGGKVRDLLEEHGERLGVELHKSSKARNKWNTKGGGGMQTAGAGGAITGKGADLFIIDDPFKNSEEANSEVIRKKVWDWYQSTVFTRLEPGAVLVLVQTRWHEDDLAGRIIDQEPEKWFHLDFPAVAEEADVLERQPGDPLWPERYNQESLNDIKESVGSYVWNALYQQRPFIEGGGIIKPSEFHRYQLKDGVYSTSGGLKAATEATTWRFITVDTAGTTKTYSDYTAAAVIDVTPDGEGLLRDMIRVKIESADHLNWLRNLEERYNPRFIGIENRSYGTTLLQTARRAGIRTRELKADTDKVTRAMGMTPFIETGRLQLPNASPWLADLEHELAAFPFGTHDDQVDALAYAAVVLKQKVRSPVRPPQAAPTREARILDRLKKKKKTKHPLLGSL